MFLVKNKQKELFIPDEKRLFDKKREFNKNIIKTIGLPNQERSMNNPRSNNKKAKVKDIYYNRPQTTRNVKNANNPLFQKSSFTKTPNKRIFSGNSKTESSNPNILTSKYNTTNANTVNKSIEKSNNRTKKLSQLKKYDNFFGDNEEEKLQVQKEYYQLDDGKKSDSYRKSLLNIANCVYAYNDEKIILNKIKKFTKDYSCSQIKIVENKKTNRFGKLQTIPTTVCFGKCVPKKRNLEENCFFINNTNLIKRRIKNKSINPSKRNHKNYMDLFKKGFDENDKRFIINTERNKNTETKDEFGNIIYPVFNLYNKP